MKWAFHGPCARRRAACRGSRTCVSRGLAPLPEQHRREVDAVDRAVGRHRPPASVEAGGEQVHRAGQLLRRRRRPGSCPATRRCPARACRLPRCCPCRRAAVPPSRRARSNVSHGPLSLVKNTSVFARSSFSSRSVSSTCADAPVELLDHVAVEAARALAGEVLRGEQRHVRHGVRRGRGRTACSLLRLDELRPPPRCSACVSVGWSAGRSTIFSSRISGTFQYSIFGSKNAARPFGRRRRRGPCR